MNVVEQELWRVINNLNDDDVQQNAQSEALYRPRINFQLRTHEFVVGCRANGRVISALLDRIGPRLQHLTDQNCALSPHQRLVVALRALAGGARQIDVGLAQGVSQSTVSRCVDAVVDAVLETLYDEYVSWPTRADDRADIARRFALLPAPLFGFVDVCGCMDGTLVKFKWEPDEWGIQYFNGRVKDYALNVLLVCGPEHQIYYACTDWPGAMHDIEVLRRSELWQRFAVHGWRPFQGAVLLADQGYVGSPTWVHTPHRGAPGTLTDVQYEHNAVVIATRTIVENTNRLLKGYFAIFGEGFRTRNAEKAALIVMACAALYNFIRAERRERGDD